MTLRERVRPSAGLIPFLCIFALPWWLATAGLALAHGTHPQFISPESEEAVQNVLVLHVESTEHDFPYVHVTIRPYSETTGEMSEATVGATAKQAESWSGLIPIGPDGYLQHIDVAAWSPGLYEIELRLIGDFMEHTEQRVFSVVAGSK